MTTRVMLVDDAVVVRHVLSDALGKDSDLTIVASASDGQEAIDAIPTAKPDVVVLDIEMPVLDGIAALKKIKQQWPHIKVIMFSTLTSHGATATMDALMAGADDYVCKPANVQSVEEAIAMVNSDLLPRIKALRASRHSITPAINPATAFTPPSAPTVATPSASATTDSSPQVPSAHRYSPNDHHPQVLAIAISTGGPNALASFIPQLPGDLAVPVVIVQHIPPLFSKALADRLDSKSGCRVSEAVNGAILQPGEIWIAPGDHHMTVQRDGASVRITTNQNPPENSCRPAADVLFRSVAAAYGNNALGLVMTGMGYDGLAGSREIVEQGGRVIAQDELSSVVWGMPGAVVKANLADKVVSLDHLPLEIVTRCGTLQSSSKMGIPAK